MPPRGNMGHFQKLPFLLSCLCFVRIHCLEIYFRTSFQRTNHQKTFEGKWDYLVNFSTHYFIVYHTGSCCQWLCIDLHKQTLDPERFSQRKCPSDRQTMHCLFLFAPTSLSFFPSLTLFETSCYNFSWLMDRWTLNYFRLFSLSNPFVRLTFGWVTDSHKPFLQVAQKPHHLLGRTQ